MFSGETIGATSLNLAISTPQLKYEQQTMNPSKNLRDKLLEFKNREPF